MTSAKDRVLIFDATLRDGEQSPGASMNLEEKLKIALLLEEMGVDVVEAGFPISSNGDFEAIRRIAESVTTRSSQAGASRQGRHRPCRRSPRGRQAQAGPHFHLHQPEEAGKSVNGQASDIDMIVASAPPCIHALNKLLDKRQTQAPAAISA